MTTLSSLRRICPMKASISSSPMWRGSVVEMILFCFISVKMRSNCFSFRTFSVTVTGDMNVLLRSS